MESMTMSSKRVNLTIPGEPELRHAIRDAAKADDRQMADMCRVILRKALMADASAPAQQAPDANTQPAASVQR